MAAKQNQTEPLKHEGVTVTGEEMRGEALGNERIIFNKRIIKKVSK